MINIAQELRQAVLQAAIQGKLTEQLPEDGDARDLLAQIKAEKERLIKEEKIKKEKPLEPILENEVPFDIPLNWEWAQLQSISSIITDGEHKTPARIKQFEGYYLLSARNVCNGKIDLSNVDYVDQKEYERISKRCNPKQGDILISCSGSVGRIAVVCDNNAYVMVRSSAMVRTLYQNEFYIMYALQAPCLQSQISDLTKQTAQANLFLGAINQLCIPIPPISEQNRIVAQINELMAKIDELEKIENELKALHQAFPSDMKTALLQAAMQGKLTEQLPEDGNASKRYLSTKNHIKLEEAIDIPCNWINTHLEDITNSIATKPYQILESQIKPEGLYPVISQSKLYSIGFSDLEDKVLRHSKKLVAFGDHTTVVKTIDFPCVIGADGVKLFECLDDIIPEYLYYCMVFNASQISGMGGYSRHYKYIKNKPIPLPPLAEQHRIVERLDKLLPLCDSLLTEL